MLLRNVMMVSTNRISWTSNWYTWYWGRNLSRIRRRNRVESLMIWNDSVRIVTNIVLLSVRIRKSFSVAILSKYLFPFLRSIQDCLCFSTNLIQFVIGLSFLNLSIITVFPNSCVVTNSILCILILNFWHLSFENFI